MKRNKRHTDYRERDKSVLACRQHAKKKKSRKLLEPVSGLRK
jgi:hypothetical protein